MCSVFCVNAVPVGIMLMKMWVLKAHVYVSAKSFSVHIRSECCGLLLNVGWTSSVFKQEDLHILNIYAYVHPDANSLSFCMPHNTVLSAFVCTVHACFCSVKGIKDGLFSCQCVMSVRECIRKGFVLQLYRVGSVGSITVGKGGTLVSGAWVNGGHCVKLLKINI